MSRTTTSTTHNSDKSTTERTTVTRSDGSGYITSETFKMDWGGLVKDTISRERTEFDTPDDDD